MLEDLLDCMGNVSTWGWEWYHLTCSKKAINSISQNVELVQVFCSQISALLDWMTKIFLTAEVLTHHQRHEL